MTARLDPQIATRLLVTVTVRRPATVNGRGRVATWTTLSLPARVVAQTEVLTTARGEYIETTHQLLFSSAVVQGDEVSWAGSAYRKIESITGGADILTGEANLWLAKV